MQHSSIQRHSERKREDQEMTEKRNSTVCPTTTSVEVGKTCKYTYKRGGRRESTGESCSLQLPHTHTNYQQVRVKKTAEYSEKKKKTQQKRFAGIRAAEYRCHNLHSSSINLDVGHSFRWCGGPEVLLHLLSTYFFSLSFGNITTKHVSNNTAVRYKTN